MAPLTVVSVGYPLAAVSPDSAGGAEQILSSLDRALVARGHRSIVIAPEGSLVAGVLRPIPSRSGVLDEAARAGAQADTREAIASTLRSEPVDVVHLHGIDFPAYLPPPGAPVLATLHLPPDWYPADALNPARPDTWLNCVSDVQQARCPPSPALLPAIANGIDIDSFGAHHAKRSFALFLGRICPEKGVHLAIEAARLARVPLLIAGHVYGYAAHQDYFDAMVRPHLGRLCRFLGPIGLVRKRRLLGAARCVLVPSLAAETSSLVAREAAAAGTPVIAFPNGAMADTVEHGRTGFLVEDAEAMAQAIADCGVIAAETCRAVAATRFSDRPMVEAYLALYARLAAARLRHAG
jgi:glycosyltransferase involved in cell wall biosynthesis